MASGGSSPFFGEEVMAITSGGDARTQLPQKFKTTQKALFLPFSREVVIFTTCWRLEAMGEQRREEEKRMILTRNNPFDFDGDLKMIENEV